MSDTCVYGIVSAKVDRSTSEYSRTITGLFKGSVTPDSENAHYGKLERPTSLNRLKSVYGSNASYLENGCDDGQVKNRSKKNQQANATMTNGGGATVSADANVSMSILSPFDEQEEWAKISEIMASFGSNFDRESIVTELEQEFDSRLGECDTQFSGGIVWGCWVVGGLEAHWSRASPHVPL